MNALVVVAAVCLLVLSVNGDDACLEVTPPQKKFHINIPNDFIVDVEIVTNETSSIQNMRLFYSTATNITRMDILANSVRSSMYFYYDDNEILVFNFFAGRGECRVLNDLVSATDDFLFGGIRTDNGVDTHIPVPLAALHLIGMSGFRDRQIVQKPIGTKQIRGKQANAYTSCQKWKSETNDILLNVTHYFADDKYLFPGGKGLSTLLSIEVEGIGTLRGKSNTPISHSYNYFNFKTGIQHTNDVLETPDGIVCAGRKVDKQFPNLPDHIRYHAETVDHVHNVVVNSEESYNYRDRYAVTRSLTNRLPGTILTVMDFNNDEMYVMDTEECKKIAIDKTVPQSELPLYSVNEGKAVMSNPTKFFYAEDKDFSYLGKKWIRGMWTDTWVAQTKDLNHFPEAVIQWHFASRVKSWNDKSQEFTKNHWPTPVKYTFWPDSQYDKGITKNIFDVDYTHTWTDQYDVSLCFNKTRYFQLAFKGTRQDIYTTGVEAFSQESTLEIARIANVSALKVNQLEFFYSETEVFMEFAISDDSDLQAEADRIHQAVNSKTISLIVTDSKTKTDRTVTVHNVSSTPPVDPKTHKSAETGGGDDGYSSGAMAGLGVAMILVGLTGGAGAGLIHTRYYIREVMSASVASLVSCAPTTLHHGDTVTGIRPTPSGEGNMETGPALLSLPSTGNPRAAWHPPAQPVSAGRNAGHQSRKKLI